MQPVLEARDIVQVLNKKTVSKGIKPGELLVSGEIVRILGTVGQN